MDAATITQIISVASSGVAVVIGLHTKVAISDAKEDIKKWINGSFMRSALVDSKIETLKGLIENPHCGNCQHRPNRSSS